MQGRSVYAAFESTAGRFGAQPFLHLVSDTARRYGLASTSFSYADGLEEVHRLAEHYSELGLQAGHRVALALDNRPEFFFHWLALNALSVSVVPLNPQWRSAELEYVFEHSEARLVVALADRASRLREVSASVDDTFQVIELGSFTAARNAGFPGTAGAAETECALLYTSGTTGKPKGCVLSNEYFLCCGDWYRNLGGLCALQDGVERLVTPLPMYHMNAMAVSSMAMILTGGCIVALDRFHPGSWWQSVRESEATGMHYLGVMPAMLMSLAPGDDDTNHRIRFGFGAGLSGELHTRFEDRFGIKLVEAWAMTETGCSAAVIANEEPRKVGTACFGRPPAHLDYRLVDDEDEAVQSGQPGELLVRRRGENPGYGFFSGYLKDPQATAAAWLGGYFRTGDLVYLDEDGCLHFVDRKKNVIRRSGENISAVEVEETILEHPDVSAVAVAAVPDQVRGDEVFACVVSRVEPARWSSLVDEIVEHCLTRLAYFKAPGYIGRCEALPLTATEKVQRVQLKALARQMLESGNCVDTRSMKSVRHAG